MDTNLASPLGNTYRTPAIRHLAWLCQTSQLMRSPITFAPAQYLPSDYTDILKTWDQATETAPPMLLEPPQRRLGFYFERLYQVLLEDLLGWPVLLKISRFNHSGAPLANWIS